MARWRPHRNTESDIIGLTNVIAGNERRKCQIKQPEGVVCLTPRKTAERAIGFHSSK